jgi:Domain of unknown function (DUF932)
VRQHLPRRRARRERTGTTFSFIHKASWRNRIEEARQAVTGTRTEMRRYAELADELLGISISPKQRELFVTDFIPMPPQGLVTDRVARNVEEARQTLRLIFESKTTQQVAGTGYGLVQAAGEYLDHVRTARSWETRLNQTFEGGLAIGGDAPGGQHRLGRRAGGHPEERRVQERHRAWASSHRLGKPRGAMNNRPFQGQRMSAKGNAARSMRATQLCLRLRGVNSLRLLHARKLRLVAIVGC